MPPGPRRGGWRPDRGFDAGFGLGLGLGLAAPDRDAAGDRRSATKGGLRRLESLMPLPARFSSLPAEYRSAPDLLRGGNAVPAIPKAMKKWAYRKQCAKIVQVAR
jgi:hypothetical protein